MSGSDDINQFVEKDGESTDKSIVGADNRGKAAPAGKLSGSASKSVAATTTVSLGNNPISLMGSDIVAQAVGGVTQNLVRGINQTATGALKNLSGITDTVFSAFALASTAQVEVIMELARGNARELVKSLNDKDAIIKSMQQDVTALFNALTLLLNSQPFFSGYVQNLLLAFAKIQNSERKLKSVVSILKLNHFYNSVEFDNAFQLLVDAQALILPDPTAKISQIRSGPLLDGVSSVTHAKEALAAALTIPGLTANIGKKFLTYTTLTIKINGLLSLFVSSLADFINAYKRNDNIDQATINHINSGVDQIDSLLADMGVVLFPTDGSNNSPLYPTAVTAAASIWGLQLTPIIEWLRLQPGKASKQLDQTGESVKRYQAAVFRISQLGDRRVNLATLSVIQGAEDPLATGRSLLQILLTANTVISSRSDPTNALGQIRQMRDLLSAAQGLDSDLRFALTPFIQTPNNLIGGADRIVGNLIGLANGLGLDRAASLLKTANMSSFFTMSSETATFVGAAAVGVKSIIKIVNNNPNSTDQDKQKLQTIDTEFSRQNATKKVEAKRSASTNTELFVAQKKKQHARIKLEGDQATKIEQKYNGQTLSADEAAKQNALLEKITQTIGKRYL